MRGYAVAVSMLILATVSSVVASDYVSFKGLGKSESDDPLVLRARLTKPDGEGPFPAVII